MQVLLDLFPAGLARPSRAAVSSPRLPLAVAPAPGEEAFVEWLEAEMADAPGRAAYSSLYADGIQAVGRWRRRYRDNPSLWRRLYKPGRILKELVETAPVIAAVLAYVEALPPGRRATVVDLCCGKGYLSMFLAELLPPERVRGCVLVDKAWPRHDIRHDTPADRHINPEHIWGYRDAWPLPLATSALDLKKRCSRKRLGERLGDGDGDDAVLLLGVHLCGTLSLRACELFNDNDAAALLVLKPCCLPGMAHARDVFALGSHSFAAREVAAPGRFTAGGAWVGPPRRDLAERFGVWCDHLLRGVAVGEGGAKAIERAEIQVKGGFQNQFLFAERGRRTDALWRGLEARRPAGAEGEAPSERGAAST